MREASDHKLLARKIFKEEPKRFLALLAAVVLAGEQYNGSSVRWDDHLLVEDLQQRELTTL